jgi:hypothetical protein
MISTPEKASTGDKLAETHQPNSSQSARVIAPAYHGSPCPRFAQMVEPTQVRHIWVRLQ